MTRAVSLPATLYTILAATLAAILTLTLAATSATALATILAMKPAATLAASIGATVAALAVGIATDLATADVPWHVMACHGISWTPSSDLHTGLAATDVLRRVVAASAACRGSVRGIPWYVIECGDMPRYARTCHGMPRALLRPAVDTATICRGRCHQKVK